MLVSLKFLKFFLKSLDDAVQLGEVPGDHREVLDNLGEESEAPVQASISQKVLEVSRRKNIRDLNYHINICTIPSLIVPEACQED